jgi:deaminated glutathione amidase
MAGPTRRRYRGRVEPIRAAVAQLRATSDHAACMREATAACQTAVDRAATLVVLPENYAGIAPRGAPCTWAFDPARPQEASALAPLCELSARRGISIIAGGTPELAPDGRRFNTAVVLIGGRIVARYRKLHLFDADVPGQPRLRESDEVAAGDGAVLVHTPAAAIGLSICYDLRFAELYRALVDAGAEVLTVPAAFTYPTGEAHWEVLVRARAIETQCFVLAAAQHGEHGGGRRSWGHAMIVDPWGRILAEADGTDAIVVADLAPAVLDQARSVVPCLRHHVDPHRLAVTHVEVAVPDE